MVEILSKYIPNVLNSTDEILVAIYQTLIMVSISGILSLIFGVLLGVTLVVTRKNGILENTVINNILDKVINVFRSIPFIILIAAIMPLTRWMVGTAIGIKGAIVPLVIGTVPFFSRQIESALLEINKGIVEAAQAMGSGPMDIIFRVYLKEGLPGIIRGVTITFISLIGSSAIAGAVGGGGIGDLAIRYGYQRFQADITYISVILLLILVSIIQGVGNLIIKKVTH
ncbi:methionine ABC transporter permease [Alkaliphilus oremlandii]|uniref:Binding-protein-dependent transport systems inner membrane component n=1 Tax=Alkaliphilus oremlandii (strain OhILAs) TaxID=350688 RepID=A8MFQ4_ALKOO|nr:methionine ABC transporter permease [Alkaliphilus oremlandii]ABW17693.1 binding-protein-dependent transport systems inner membrane component [Alkaliphilus oremlandii OhILAs]